MDELHRPIKQHPPTSLMKIYKVSFRFVDAGITVRTSQLVLAVGVGHALDVFWASTCHDYFSIEITGIDLCEEVVDGQ